MPTLALSMIVKNGASDLPECLASVAGVVDEIVIADTGSSDGSLELAAKLGAKALPVVWEDDYAKARNLSLAQVTADWVLTLDADERLDPEAGARIPALIANPSAAGYQVTIRNYVADAGKKVWDRPSHPNDGSYAPARQYPAYIDHENVRLFRREPEIYFTGCVHETVGWRIAETGGKVGPANFLIHHFGMVRGEETLRRKILFYRELGLKKIVDSPENAQAHFEVGIVEMENLGDVSSALPYFERACELNPKLGVAWFFAAKALFAQSQFAPALRALQSAERAGHAKAAVAELAGDAHYNLGDHPAAAESYRRALKREPQSASIESKLGLAASTAYNTVLSDLNKQFQVSSSTSQPGPLQSDSTLALAQSQILSTISFAMTGNGSVNTLADLGITMNNDGTLTVNSTTLAGALQTTPGTVLSFFSATNAGGFGQNLYSQINAIADPITGSVAQDLNGLQQSQTDLTQQISDFQSQLSVTQQQLTQQYDQVDVTLQELPLLLQQVNQQLASLG